MGNFLGIRLPNASKLVPMLSSVAPFIPGVGPGIKAGLMGLNALMGGSDAARKAGNANSKVEQGYDQQIENGQNLSSMSMGHLAPMLKQYTDMVSNGGIPNFDARYRGYMDGNAPGYDNAVKSTMQDFGDRGIGLNSSPLMGAVSGIRGKQQQAGLNFRQGLMTEAMDNKQQMLQNAVPMLSGLYGQGNQMTIQGLSGMGGVGGMYQSQSDAFGNDLGKLGEFLPGILGMGNKNPNAGNNTLGTNQVVSPGNISEPGRQLPGSMGVDDDSNLLGPSRAKQTGRLSMSIPKVNLPRVRL